MASDDSGANEPERNEVDDVQVVELTDDEHDDLIAERAPAGRRVSWSWAVAAGIVALVVLIGVTVGAGIATRQEATAATVNGHDITASQLQDLVDAYRKNPEIAPQFLANGQVPTDRTARLLQQLVIDRVIRDELARRHALPTAQQIAQTRASIVAQNDPKLIKGFSKGFLDAYAERSANIDAIAGSVGSDPDGSKFNALLEQLLRKAHIHVDPRYGVYAPNVATGVVIVPPAAPRVKVERNNVTTTTAADATGG
jgi:hypothetical protein